MHISIHSEWLKQLKILSFLIFLFSVHCPISPQSYRWPFHWILWNQPPSHMLLWPGNMILTPGKIKLLIVLDKLFPGNLPKNMKFEEWLWDTGAHEGRCWEDCWCRDLLAGTFNSRNQWFLKCWIWGKIFENIYSQIAYYLF